MVDSTHISPEISIHAAHPDDETPVAETFQKRKVALVVLSDIHLGTYGCHARELLQYLKTIEPGRLVLNGDIIDMWQFTKRYWPQSHMQVVQHLTELVSNGTPVYYITGNHDEMLRRFKGFSIGSFHILNKLLLQLPSGKAWIFHGDVFDVTMKHSKWLAKFGGKGYDLLILMNRLVNWISEKLGGGRISLSKRIKDNVKSAVKFISNFEDTAADLAIENQYAYVVCGHIHQPVIRDIQRGKESVTYLNSGDWVENLTGLEYHDGTWRLYHYDQDPIAQSMEISQKKTRDNELFLELVKEFLPGEMAGK